MGKLQPCGDCQTDAVVVEYETVKSGGDCVTALGFGIGERNIKKLIQNRAGDAARRRVHVDATSSSRPGDCPLCKSFGDFRKAIRRGSIDAVTAKRIFNRHFVRLREICKRENCSMERARTINAVLECDIDYAFRREGKPGFLKAYDSLETLLKDLKS